MKGGLNHHHRQPPQIPNPPPGPVSRRSRLHRVAGVSPARLEGILPSPFDLPHQPDPFEALRPRTSCPSLPDYHASMPSYPRAHASNAQNKPNSKIEENAPISSTPKTYTNSAIVSHGKNKPNSNPIPHTMFRAFAVLPEHFKRIDPPTNTSSGTSPPGCSSVCGILRPFFWQGSRSLPRPVSCGFGRRSAVSPYSQRQ